jgi:hypothetical protein
MSYDCLYRHQNQHGVTRLAAPRRKDERHIQLKTARLLYEGILSVMESTSLYRGGRNLDSGIKQAQ